MFIEMLKKELEQNNGRISQKFVNKFLNHPSTTITHIQPTPNTRVCVITLTTGHDLVGYAQVVDSKNDVELIGKEIAYKNASKEIWSVFGSIAKIIGL